MQIKRILASFVQFCTIADCTVSDVVMLRDWLLKQQTVSHVTSQFI